jgi:hypothetical protein
VFTDSGEFWSYKPDRSYLPGLLRTCRQLRTTFPLYFKLNELYFGYPWESDIPVRDWGMTREATLAFLQAMPETLRNMIRRVCFTVPRAIDLLHAITSHRKQAADGNGNDHLRPTKILLLASMTGLKRVTIYVSKNDSTTDLAPVLKALLGAPPEAVVKVRKGSW